MLENNSRWVANWIEALLSLAGSILFPFVLSLSSESFFLYLLISKAYEK